MSDLPTGTVTFLFTDIEGSTRLAEQYPGAVQEAQARHDARIRRIEPDRTVVTSAGSGQKGRADGPARSAQFDRPRDLAIGADGTVYVIDQGNHCVRAIRPA